MPSSETRPSLEAKSSKDHPSSTEKSAPKITSESNENNALVARGRSASKLRSLSWFCIVFSLLAALFLFALDNTIVADVQPRILHTLGGVEKLPWISVAFALGAVSTNLFWGQMYSFFDNKVLFVSSVVIFEVGSAVCGAAPTLDALIVGRAICGIGGMGIYLGTMNMVSALTKETERPMYLGFVGLTWGIGTIMGPIIGGAFADSSATWRWSFYINLCIGGVAAPVYLFLLPSTKPATVGTLRFMARIGRLDLIGTVLSTGAIATLVMATSFGGGVYAWNSGQIIGLFVSTGVLWLAFVLQQWFSVFTTPRDRLFPTELLKSWEMDILFVQMASAQVIVTIPIYFIPLYFQFAKDFTALHSGVELLPFVLLLVFAVMLNGALMAKFGYYMPWYAAGSAVTLVGSALLYTIDMETPKSRVYGYSILAAFGVGLFSQAGFPVAQVKSTPEQLQQAVAFMGIGQVGGITLALMMSNSIFLNRATDKVATILPDTAQTTIQQAILGFGNSFFYSLDVVERGKVLTAIVESIGDTFVLVITAATLCLVLSLFMKREKLFIDRVATT